MSGQLFAQYFLEEGIKTTTEWEESSPATAELAEQLSEIWHNFSKYNEPNEATTEQDLIIPVLQLLGWTNHLPQQGSGRNQDIPDFLLFGDARAKEQATRRASAEERYLDALVVLENKRLELPLDRRDGGDKVQTSTPHGQILRYLSSADTASDGKIRWGILTNGSKWRLYDRSTRPRSTAYFETDLPALLQSEDDVQLFRLLFGCKSFSPQGGETSSFLEGALEESRRYEEKVAQDLSALVFEEAFPKLIQALVDSSTDSLEEVREAALIFLYRMLFLLYAEDRGLLPVNDSRYEEYGLRKPVREDIARRIQDNIPFSGSASSYYDHLTTLCRMVDKGDPEIGIPPYNGGLFSADSAQVLGKVRLSDAVVAPIIHNLSHVNDKSGAHYVNYRDMSVQQLGSIYERLLEREPVRDSNGNVVIIPNRFARKDTGSYFTPQELVDLIVDQTLTPLLTERIAKFEVTGNDLEEDTRPASERLSELMKSDPAEAVLDLKVLDPAMGSGHFLVTAVDFLSDRIAELTENTPGVPHWIDGKYTSPLVERIDAIRRDIVQRARESHWNLDEAQLTDQTIIRRMVLKRCIYGVDKNPLTVELAKVSLWLHSFTVGAPLSFLDHHLRHGDALLGLRVSEAIEELNRLGALFASPAIAGAEAAADSMELIESKSDADISEVQESAFLFTQVEDTTADLRNIMDTLCGMKWLTAGMKAKERKNLDLTMKTVLMEESQESYSLLAYGPNEDQGKPEDSRKSYWTQFEDTWHHARSTANRETFLHWEVSFPGVWQSWTDANRKGGFDVVIGNPPWDQIELPEKEWFALRFPELAQTQKSADRKRAMQQLRDRGSPLIKDFDEAKEVADNLSLVIRTSGQYPLLGRGRINLYSLFVERATTLLKPDGVVGLLIPSGIYGDKNAAPFFKAISTAGRIGAIFDFENRRTYFKEVHASFKFCALIFGGEERVFPEAQCAFFLRNPEEINSPSRCFSLTAADFERVNPNTGTAPIFRTQRDADITRSIYAAHPVIFDSSKSQETNPWPVSFKQGHFNMTTDSSIFRTQEQLKAGGFYFVEGNTWRKNEEVYVPLYEGKMVQAFDHRAASITTRDGNLFRPGQSDRTLEQEHRNPAFAPNPRYWVSEQRDLPPKGPQWMIAFKDVTATTNVRTMIASIIPRVGCGHTLPILLPSDDSFSAATAACCLANLNSFVFDYVARQKVPATHLTWYIVEQLPVIDLKNYSKEFGGRRANEIVEDHVLKLTYNAHDMAPFAKDMGYESPPFTWNEEERLHLQARLDALYFLLYGISHEDADYILSTFPIVQREDEEKFGTYRTRNLIMGYMSALAAGDTETKVAG